MYILGSENIMVNMIDRVPTLTKPTVNWKKQENEQSVPDKWDGCRVQGDLNQN